MPIIFYDCKTAPSPRRARILLAEKNVPHETVDIDMMKNEQMSDEYRGINPACTIPTLKLEDGTVLTDNAGIAAYIEDAYPDPPLLGTSAIEKGQIASWQSKIEGGLGMSVANAFRNSHPAMKGRALPGPDDYEQIPALADRGMAQVDAFLDRFEIYMTGRDFVVGTQLSVADITAGCMVDFARVVGKKLGDDRPNIRRWRAGLAERPSFNL